MDILERGAAVCDELVVGIGVNPDKRPYLPVEVREELLAKAIADAGLGNVRVIHYTGATVAWAQANGITTLIRGLRSSQDLK